MYIHNFFCFATAGGGGGERPKTANHATELFFSFPNESLTDVFI